MRRLVFVVVETGPPVGVVVLGQPPSVVPGLPVDGEIGDLDRAFEPFALAGDVSRHEERLDCVHGGVDAAVVLGVGEVGGVGFDRQSVFAIPPVAILDGRRLLEELVRAWTPGGGGGRSRQEHEGVLVALFAGRRIDRGGMAGLVDVVPDRAPPAAVLMVFQSVAERAHAVVGVAAAARNAQQRADGEGERHASRDPQFHGV